MDYKCVVNAFDLKCLNNFIEIQSWPSLYVEKIINI